MKKFRKLIPAFIMLLVSAILVSTATYAWFSMNSQVTATGMQVKAQADSSLVIQNDATKLGASFGTNSTATFAALATTKSLKPATHTSSGATYLQYLADGTKASTATGIAQTGATLNPVPEASDSPYYIDYVVYIASASNDIADAAVNVVINGNASTDTKKALSIDFYVSNTTTFAVSDYKTTVNLTNLDGSNNTTPAPLTTSADGMTIPLYTSTGTNNVYMVTMRVYFDGAITYDNYTLTTDSTAVSGKTYYELSGSSYTVVSSVTPDVTDVSGYYEKTTLAYVRSSNADLTDIGLTVKFSLVS